MPVIPLWNKITVLQSQIFYGWLSATLLSSYLLNSNIRNSVNLKKFWFMETSPVQETPEVDKWMLICDTQIEWRIFALLEFFDLIQNL